MSYLEKLNSEQKEAVIQTEGPVLIIAGAGAGKTRTLMFRIAHLIKKGISPRNIMAVTFTNKAASEMNERINHLLLNEIDLSNPISEHERPNIKTFHSLGVQILRNHADAIGHKKSFSIYDRDDSKKLLRQIIKDLGLDPKELDTNKIISIISKQKGDMLEPFEYYQNNINSYYNQNIYQIWQKYESRLKEEGAFDFDDLLSKSYEVLAKNSDIRNFYQNLYKYIHIDEYQDTNNIQYEISKMLADNHKNICVVGDIDQNIYSWRGASIKNMLNFEKDFPNAKVIKLEENYRSTKNILSAANQIIKKNKNRIDKNLFTSNKDGDKINIHNAIDEYDEARFMVQEAKNLISKGVPANEIAVLFRANFQSRVLEEVCLQEKIPHQVLGTRFFERKEIKDIVSYIKLANNPDDFSSLSRIINEPARGIGKTTLLKIRNKEQEGLNKGTKEKINNFWSIISQINNTLQKEKLSVSIANIIKISGIEQSLIKQGEEGLERLDNLRELVSLAKKYDFLVPEQAVNNFLEDVALATDQDSLSKDNGGIKLMTIHASKGLEFDYVFVVGLEQGLFPFERESSNDVDDEEERRLFYVAITRARKKLYLSWAVFRTIFGKKDISSPSEFLEDIDESLIEKTNYSGQEDTGRQTREYLIDF
jgi:DNA helicase II / ATP-dependent DNA helicase PcrA